MPRRLARRWMKKATLKKYMIAGIKDTPTMVR